MLARTAAFIVVVAMAAACGSTSKINVAPPASSASIAETELIARVKTALLNDTVVGVRRIDVHASGDQIRLTGRVASAAERDRAVELTRAVPGVRSVTSDLEIRP